MLIYLLKSAILLALLYGSFALLLSRETFHRFNRLALLSVLVASLVLPAVQLSLNMPTWLNFSDSPSVLSDGAVDFADASMLPSEHLTSSLTERTRGEYFIIFLTVVYLIGVLASLSLFVVQLFRFWRETKSGVRTKDECGNTIIIRGGDFAPYSFFHYIIISAADYEQLREPILVHEQAHIRLGHSWDLMLLQLVSVVQWFNPFIYLLGRDLKAVHEYEADSVVLQLGIDAKTYQLLLVTKAVGNRLQTIVNNLSHHSLKKRITMMHKKNSNRWLMTKGVILPALMAVAVVAFAKPKTATPALPVSEGVVTVEEESLQSTNHFAVFPDGDDKIYDIVDVMAGFPGGDEACYKWLAGQLKYPPEAVKNKIQGRVHVSFVVEKDGTITHIQVRRSPNDLLANEAIRVIKLMPKWTPAKVGNKIVRSTFILPIVFKLPSK